MPADAGFVLAVFAAIVALAAGVYGTWAAVHNAKSREEKAAIVKVATAMWAGIAFLSIPSTLALMGAIDRWTYLVLVSLFVVALVPFVIWANRCVAKACRVRDGLEK